MTGALTLQTSVKDGPGLKDRAKPADKIESGTGWHRQDDQIGAPHRPAGVSAISETAEALSAATPSAARGGVTDHPGDAREAGLPGERSADRAQADDGQRGWAHQSEAVGVRHAAHAPARMRRLRPP